MTASTPMPCDARASSAHPRTSTAPALAAIFAPPAGSSMFPVSVGAFGFTHAVAAAGAAGATVSVGIATGAGVASGTAVAHATALLSERTTRTPARRTAATVRLPCFVFR